MIGIGIGMTERTYQVWPELVVNGDISNGTANWVAMQGIIAAVDGALEVKNGAGTGGFDWAEQPIPTIPGVTYRLTTRLRAGTTSALVEIIGIAGAQTPIVSSASFVTETFTFMASAASHLVKLKVQGAADGATAYFDDVSVRRI